MIDKPKFMEDDSWYYFDEEEFKYKLTDKAPDEAVTSYNDYYNMLNREAYGDDEDEQ